MGLTPEQLTETMGATIYRCRRCGLPADSGGLCLGCRELVQIAAAPSVASTSADAEDPERFDGMS